MSTIGSKISGHAAWRARRQSFWLYMILLVALVLRIFRLDDISLRGDEAISQYYAQLPLPALFDILRTSLAHPPLYYLFFREWLAVAGESVLSFRFPSFLGGLVIIPLIFQVGTLLAPSHRMTVGLVTAFLAAINPFLTTDAQDARVYSLFFALCLASVYCFLRAMRDDWQHRLWLGYIVCTILAFYSHYLAIVMIAIQNLIWATLALQRMVSREVTVLWFAAQVVVALLFTPWAWLALPVFQGSGVGVGSMVTLPELLTRTFLSFAIGLANVWTPFPTWTQVLAVLGFLPLLMAGLWPWMPKGGPAPAPQIARWGTIRALLISGIYLLVPMFALFIFSIWRYPIYDERYVLMALTPFLFFLGRGWLVLLTRRWSRWLAITCLVLVAGLSGHSLYRYHFDMRYSKSPAWREFVQRLLENAQPNDLLVQNYPDPALPYHLRDRMPRVLLPIREGGGDPDTTRFLERLATHPGRIWLQPQRSKWDETGQIESWLDRKAYKLAEESIGLLSLSLYLPPRILLGETPNRQATLGNNILLLGWRVGPIPTKSEPRFDRAIPTSGPVTLRTDERLEVALFWQATRQIQEAYTVFVHLYGPDGSLWAQQDNQPMHDRYPTNQWSLGEIVVDTYRLPLKSGAATGTCHLAIGMYTLKDLERLSARDAAGQPLLDNRVFLTEVIIVRP